MRTVLIAAATAVVVVALYALFLAPSSSETGGSGEPTEVGRRVEAPEAVPELRELPAAGDREEPPPARAEPEAPPGSESATAPAEPPARSEDLDRWLEQLSADKENLAFTAALELGRLKDARAVPALAETLATHRDNYVRLGAATALGDIRALDAVPALVEALLDKDQLVRTAAYDALTKVVGAKVPYRADAPSRERRAAHDAWRKWWGDNEARLRAR